MSSKVVFATDRVEKNKPIAQQAANAMVGYSSVSRLSALVIFSLMTLNSIKPVHSAALIAITSCEGAPMVVVPNSNSMPVKLYENSARVVATDKPVLASECVVILGVSAMAVS